MASQRTLGELLEAARIRSGMTLHALSQSTGIPLTSLHRLFRDRVARPSPGHLATLADALGLARGVLLDAAGYPAAGPADGVEAALRAAYPVPEAVIAEMRAAVEAVAARHVGVVATGGAR